VVVVDCHVVPPRNDMGSNAWLDFPSVVFGVEGSGVRVLRALLLAMTVV
jgi:hypothetical protein